MRRTQLLCFVMALLVPSLALADSINPTSFNASIDVGDTVTITKTVTVDGRTVNDTNPVDVVFLFDTSASMESNYLPASWSGGSTPSLLIQDAFGVGGNVQVGVARYEDWDYSPWGNAGDTPYTVVRSLTTNAAQLQVDLQGFSTSAGVGGDNPEANLYALNELATDAGMGWRTGSTRVVVWFGDQPGHLPGELGYDSSSNPQFYPGTADLSTTIASLLGANIVVEAYDFGAMDSTGQATAITDQTGGDLATGYWLNPGGLTSSVLNALTQAMFLYDVDLDLSNVPGGLGLAVLQDGAGSGDRTNGNANYEWILQFTALANGNYSFPIHALVDGVVVATENDRITVGGDNPGPGVPEPSTIALLGLGLLGVGVVARRRKK